MGPGHLSRRASVFFLLSSSSDISSPLDEVKSLTPSHRLELTKQVHRSPPFKMETIHRPGSSMILGDWATIVDLTDAYRRVPVRVSTGRCLRFAVDGVVYTFKALPFGLNTAPWEFTRIMDAVMITVRIAYFITISNYLDDILIMNLDKDILLRGLIFYTHLNKVFLPEKRKDSITFIVNEVMIRSHFYPRILAKLVDLCRHRQMQSPWGGYFAAQCSGLSRLWFHIQ